MRRSDKEKEKQDKSKKGKVPSRRERTIRRDDGGTYRTSGRPLATDSYTRDLSIISEATKESTTTHSSSNEHSTTDLRPAEARTLHRQAVTNFSRPLPAADSQQDAPSSAKSKGAASPSGVTPSSARSLSEDLAALGLDEGPSSPRRGTPRNPYLSRSLSSSSDSFVQVGAGSSDASPKKSSSSASRPRQRHHASERRKPNVARSAVKPTKSSPLPRPTKMLTSYEYARREGQARRRRDAQQLEGLPRPPMQEPTRPSHAPASASKRASRDHGVVVHGGASTSTSWLLDEDQQHPPTCPCSTCVAARLGRQLDDLVESETSSSSARRQGQGVIALDSDEDLSDEDEVQGARASKSTSASKKTGWMAKLKGKTSFDQFKAKKNRDDEDKDGDGGSKGKGKGKKPEGGGWRGAKK